MKKWDYAEMAKIAKELGGPDKYADFLVGSGRKEMIPWILIASFVSLGIGIGGTIGIPKLVKFVKTKKEENKNEIEKAKEEIIKGINEYNEEIERKKANEEKGEEDYE